MAMTPEKVRSIKTAPVHCDEATSVGGLVNLGRMVSGNCNASPAWGNPYCPKGLKNDHATMHDILL